jgi:protein ImuB
MVDRLMVRLGPQQVQRAFLQDDHRPERAQRWGHPYLQESTDSLSLGLSAPTSSALRPTALLTQPEPLDEQAGQPWRHGVPLALLSSPERVEAGWFDDQPVQRDYHVATALSGELAHQWLWVFRDHQAGRWYLHGWLG